MPTVPWLLTVLLLFSAEVEVTVPVPEPVANTTDPVVATDGLDYLLVWKTLSTTTYSLSAARVTRDGTLLDPLGISLSGPTQNAAWMAPPEVQLAGGRYLVTHPSHQALDVIAVERDGRVVERGSAGNTGTGVQHRAATNGERMLVAWDEGRAALVDRDAKVVAAVSHTGVRIGSAASNGSEFLVFSGERCAGTSCPRTIVADRVSADGQLLSTRTVLDVTTLPVGTTAIDGVAATRAGARYILFARLRVPTADDPWAGSVIALLLDASGQSAGGIIDVLAGAPTVTRMRATTDAGGRAVLILEAQAGSIVARVDPASRTVERRTMEGEPQASLASAPGSALLFTGDNDPWNAKLTARFVNSDLSDDPSRRDVIPVGAAAPMQEMPSVGTNGKVFLVTWTETSGRDVLARGAILDRHGRRIGEPFSPLIHWASIASDGTDFLIVGSIGSEILAQRVSGAGALLDAKPRAIGAASGPLPKVIWNGGSYVVFTSGRETSTGPFGHVQAIRVSRTGDVIDTTAMSVPRDAQLYAVAASDGERTLVIWKDVAFHATVHFDGVLLDRENRTIASLRLSTPVAASAYPSSLSFGGGEFLLTWRKTGSTPHEVRTTRISRDGAVLGEEVLDTGLSYPHPPLAAWNGSAFDIVWLHGEILVRRGDAATVAIESPESEKNVAIAAIPSVATLVAYTRTITDATHGATTRLFVRVAPGVGGAKRRAVRVVAAQTAGSE